MNDPTLLTCGICGEKSLRVHNFVACIDALKASRDAAEERGRRRGETERETEWLDLMGLIRLGRHWMRADAPSWIKAKIDAALGAPCDSAPKPARMDALGGPVCWCGKTSTHESGWCGNADCTLTDDEAEALP